MIHLGISVQAAEPPPPRSAGLNGNVGMDPRNVGERVDSPVSCAVHVHAHLSLLSDRHASLAGFSL